ncbi:hypothetical protein KKF32_01940 [Patescibacteria group bacterium]|nr:hypothetical protein [Patescibacteria group bacterium]
MKSKTLILGILILFIVGLVMRLAPHPANFSPVAAIALFAGYYLSKRWAIILPIAVMLLTDILIGFYDWKLMLAVYSCIMLAGVVGIIIRKSKSVLNVLTATLVISLSFFIVTNLAVWLFSPWYAHNWSGLMLCYTLAVPFFKNTLAGNLFFVTVFFGSFELIRQFLAKGVIDLRQNYKSTFLK